MSLVMIKPSQLSPVAFAFDQTSIPPWSGAVAGTMQQVVQQHANLRNRQGRSVFFSPAGFPELKTTGQ